LIQVDPKIKFFFFFQIKEKEKIAEIDERSDVRRRKRKTMV